MKAAIWEAALASRRCGAWLFPLALAAFYRKVAETPDDGEIEMWGDGKQTRSFLYIDDCLEAMRRLMDSDFIGPVNIGSKRTGTRLMLMWLFLLVRYLTI